MHVCFLCEVFDPRALGLQVREVDIWLFQSPGLQEDIYQRIHKYIKKNE